LDIGQAGHLLVLIVLRQLIPIMIFGIGWQQPILKRPLFRIVEMVSAWWADTKDTLPVDTTDVFCSSAILSSCGLNDYMIDLDEFFRISGPIILVNVPGLKLVWPSDIPKWCRQSAETAPP
jgi:hypothetical protein